MTPTSAPTPALRGILLILLAMLFFASMDTVAKYLTTVYPIAQILWLRFGVFLAVALALARLAGPGSDPRRDAAGPAEGVRRPAWRSRRPLLQVVRSLVLVAEMSAFMLAFRHLPLADVHAVAAASPLIALALAALFLGEAVPLRRWLAVLCGMAGVLVILRPGFSAFGWIEAVPVVAACLWGGYQVFLRYAARYDPPHVTTFYTAATGLGAATIVAPFLWVPPDLAGWAWLALVALLGAAAHVTLIRALDSAPAAMLQPYTYTLLLWVALLGFLAFGELPDAWTVAGAAIVVGSGSYVLQADLRRARAARRAAGTLPGG